MAIGTIHSKSKMYWIMMYSTPYIQENLSSIDFLNNHVQKIDGKVPFFDDMSGFLAADPAQKKWVEKRPTLHMKDQWRVDFTVRERDNAAIVKLTNDKKTADGKWIVADLLWYGTGPYHISQQTTYKQTLVSAVPGVGQTQYPSLKQWRKYRAPEPEVQGHETKAMFFYNHYTGHFNYNRKSRLGIRDILVTSFHDYILLCVENGVRAAITMMEREGILRVHIKDVHVSVSK
jgi:hypothetical protein